MLEYLMALKTFTFGWNTPSKIYKCRGFKSALHCRAVIIIHYFCIAVSIKCILGLPAGSAAAIN